MKKFGVIKEILLVVVSVIVGGSGLILSLTKTNAFLIIGIILIGIFIGIWIHLLLNTKYIRKE